MFWPRFATCLCLLAGLFFAPPCCRAGEAPVFTPIGPRSMPAVLLQQVGQAREVSLQERVGSLLAEGKRVVLHLWMPSCPLCVKEMLRLDEAYPDLLARNIAVLAVAQDDQGKISVPAFARRYGLKNAPLYIDTPRAALFALSPQGVPTSFLIDASGKAVALHEGPIDWPRFTLPQASRP